LVRYPSNRGKIMTCVFGEIAVKILLEKARMRNIHVYCEAQSQKQYSNLLLLMSDEIKLTMVKNLSDRYPKARHQGIMATFDFSYQSLDSVGHNRILMLDRIQDPHNFGACLRSAAAFGVDAVIVPRRDSAPMSEVVHQVSCGGSLLVPVIQVNNLSQTMSELQDNGVWFVATDERAKTDIKNIALDLDLCLVMGSEGEGVKRRLKELCDYQVSISTSDELTTLNVSVATGILLHALYNA